MKARALENYLLAEPRHHAAHQAWFGCWRGRAFGVCRILHRRTNWTQSVAPTLSHWAFSTTPRYLHPRIFLAFNDGQLDHTTGDIVGDEAAFECTVLA